MNYFERIGTNEIKTSEFWTSVYSEFIGTIIFVFLACASTVKGDLVSISFCIGLSLALVIWMCGRASGGHINPAVSISFWITRHLSLLRLIFYMLSQISGGLVGAALVKVAIPNANSSSFGATLLGDNVHVGQSFLIEFIITLIFVSVVHSSCDVNREDLKGSIPLMIGLTITALHLIAVPFTGASMNPARSLGPAVVSGNMTNQWIYWIAPIMGAAFGSIQYNFVFAVNASPSKIKGFFDPRYDPNEHYEKNIVIEPHIH